MSDIEGDENDNTINGTSDDDNINGKGGNDTLNGNAGNDTVSGGDGNDSIDGGEGDDTIYGGDGDDTITGGSGEDVIVGGRGDDVMSAGNNSTTDTFVIRDGDGNDTITDFDPGEPDIIRFDMAEMSTFQDVLDRMTVDGDDVIITYDNGSTLRLTNVDPDDIGSGNFEFGPGPVCLAKGTYVETPSGPHLIEALCTGDIVVTLDRGPQPIAHIVTETIEFRDHDDRRKPILISQDALGEKVPTTDMIVSPQHRILLPSAQTGEEVLVPAVKLIKRRNIRRIKGRKSETYYNLVLDHHNIIIANGCHVETMLITPCLLPKLRGMHIQVTEKQANMSPARRLVRHDPIHRLKQATKKQLVA